MTSQKKYVAIILSAFLIGWIVRYYFFECIFISNNDIQDNYKQKKSCAFLLKHIPIKKNDLVLFQDGSKTRFDMPSKNNLKQTFTLALVLASPGDQIEINKGKIKINNQSISLLELTKNIPFIIKNKNVESIQKNKHLFINLIDKSIGKPREITKHSDLSIQRLHSFALLLVEHINSKNIYIELIPQTFVIGKIIYLDNLL